MRNITFLFLLLVGAIFLFIASLPLFFTYPYNDGPSSGPSNSWELVRIMAHESWALFLFIGLIVLMFAVLGLRKRFFLNKFLR